MTTSGSGVRRQTTAANGVTIHFPVSFKFISNSDLSVYLTDSAVFDVDSATPQTEGVDYDITGSGPAGTAVVTFGGRTPLAGEYVTRYRRTSKAQTADYVASAGFPSADHETQLDRLSLVTEELEEGIGAALDRAVRAPAGETLEDLPAADDRADTIAGFDGDGALTTYDAAELAAFVADDLPDALKGDPGANTGMTGPFTALSAQTIPTGTDVIRTSEYRAASGKGAAYYVYDAAVDAAYVTANPLTSIITANGRGFRLSTDQFVNVLMFGAYGNGTTDDAPFFTAALAWIQNGRMHVPKATYRWASMVSAKYQVHLYGDGGIDTHGTRILVDAGVTGLRVLHSSDAGMTAGQDGSFSIISNILFQAAGKTGAAYGIHISAHQVKVSNCGLIGFKTKNIAIIATAPVGNANNCVIENVRSISSDGDGLFFDGADSNACTVINFDGSSNGGYAINGDDFLGNTWVGCHSAGNTTGAYRTADTNARTMVLGCYSESGQPQAVFASKTSVIGGLHAAGINGGASALADGGALQGIFQGVKLTGSDYTQFQIGDPSVADSIAIFGNTTTASPEWRWHCDTSNNWYFTYQNQGGSKPFTCLPGTGTPGFTLPRGFRATVPTYADNAAALAGGKIATDVYKTAAGDLRIVV